MNEKKEESENEIEDSPELSVDKTYHKTSLVTEQRSLVIWGNTGKHLLFSKSDLKMPESIEKLAEHHFYVKQWNAVSSFWYNRVLKEERLQKMSVSEIIELIRKDIEIRWQRKKREHNLYKKRKRILTSNGPAGEPSTSLLLTNLIPLEKYRLMSESEKEELIHTIIEKVESVTKSEVVESEFVIDETENFQQEGARLEMFYNNAHDENNSEEEFKTSPKRTLLEANQDKQVTDNVFKYDDRLAVICTMKSKENAALAIVHLHKSLFDGRVVVSRFYDKAVQESEQTPEELQEESVYSKEKKTSALRRHANSK